MNSASQNSIQIKIQTKTEKSKKPRKKKCVLSWETNLWKECECRWVTHDESRTHWVSDPSEKSRHRRNEKQLHLRKKKKKREKIEEGDAFECIGNGEMKEEPWGIRRGEPSLRGSWRGHDRNSHRDCCCCLVVNWKRSNLDLERAMISDLQSSRRSFADRWNDSAPALLHKSTKPQKFSVRKKERQSESREGDDEDLFLSSV